MARQRVILIDGSAMLFRAYYAIPGNFSTSTGLPTNATYGFALMFNKLLASRAPTHGAVIFDAKGPTFRDAHYPDYKANRPRTPSDLVQQIPWVHEVVRAHDFPILSVPGVEADDVIGTLTVQAVAAGHEVRILSGDKDFVQLIGPDVRMIDPMRDITYDEEVVRKKWGVRPDQFVDLLALLGDKADNIPGVPGIGQKGAAGLLTRFETLDTVYEHLDTLTTRQRNALTTHRELATLSRELATIRCDVELPLTLAELHVPPVEPERVNALYRELEFNSLLSESHKALSDRAEAADVQVFDTLAALQTFLERDTTLSCFPVFDGYPGPLVGAALADETGAAGWVDLAGASPLLDAEPTLRAWARDPEKPKVLHQARRAWLQLPELEGVIGDTALASFLIDPTGAIPHRIDQVSKHVLQRPLPDAAEVLGTGKQRTTFAEADPERLATWAGLHASAIASAWPILRERLESAGQTANLHEIELPLARILAGMTRAGIRADAADLEAMGKEFADRKAAIEDEIYEMAGRTFNIGSTKQLGAVLFDELGLPVIKRTKTGYSTAADVLERLAPKHPIARRVLRQRALAKLINTYTRVLRQAIHPMTGRIHTTLQQTAGASGRLISTDPDLQRTPIRTEDGKRIRQTFVPRPGWVLISADWSQIELRILAHVSRDPTLLASFRNGIDVHRVTAASLFDVEPEAVSAEQRSVGKTVNFATIYGQGATALGQQLGIRRAEAKRYIERYFEKYAGVRAWLDETIAHAHEVGFVETYLGRRRIVRELSSNNFSDRAYGERIAANTPIQGTAADLCKLAMIAIDQQLTGREARMLLQIHDELLFEAPPHEVDEVVSAVRAAMESAAPLAVPLLVQVGTGASWAEAHP